MAATETIQIRFEAKGAKNIQVALNRVFLAQTQLTKSQKAYESALKKLNTTQKKTLDGMLMIQGATRNTGNALSVMRSKLLLASFAGTVFTATLVNFVKKAGEVQDVSRGFDNLVASIGGGEDSLKKLKDATDGTVSSVNLMKQANNAMMLGVVKSDDEMAQLFDTAQRLGQALGVETTSAINSMVTGMGRQSKLMLDNLGIMVDANEAYERFAIANNISADALSDHEKKAAFNAEVLRQSKDLVAALGEEQLNASQFFAQLYAHADINFDPHSGGRQMNCHFATRDTLRLASEMVA